MAYCSYCAAVLDPGQQVCARCGRPSAVAPIPPPAALPARPSSVRLAAIFLLISWAVSLLTLISIFVAHTLATRLPALFLLRSVGLWILWIVLIIAIWQRHNWARIGALLLFLWSIGTLVFSVLNLGGSGTLALSLAFPLLVNALRACAVYLLFKPETNLWFQKSNL